VLLPTAHSTHSFAGLQTYGLLIRPAKPSYTAGTLYAIPPKVFKKFTGWLEKNGRTGYNIKNPLKNVDKILLEGKNENYTVFEF
jgi:hypothetical protein